MEKRIGGGGAVIGNGGYSRRCIPGDSKSTDRQRLLTDRAAYISFLEAQAERANAICLETEEVGAGLQSMRVRVDELDDKIRSTARAVELVQDHSSRAGESSRAGRMEIEDHLRVLDHRVQRLEQTVGDTRSTTEAEMARLRNEVALAVQELGQRVDDRWQSLHAWRRDIDEGASGVIREAQATCVRLADDALGAVEASQHKLEELSRRADAGLEVLRVDVTSLRADLAGLAKQTQQQSASANPAACYASVVGSGVTADPVKNTGDDAASAIADVVERRLASRLGQQVLQLSEVLRRVVQAQASLHQQWSGSPPSNVGVVASSMAQASTPLPQPAAPTTAPLPSQIVDSYVPSHTGGTGFGPPGPPHHSTAATASVSDTRRRAAIDELYRELRQLEECDAAMRSPANSSRRPRNARSSSVAA